MGQRNHYAVMMESTKCDREEYVEGMEQRLQNYAAMRDATTKSSKEGFASGMVQRRRLVKLAVKKDAPTLSRREEPVLGMGRR